MNKHPEIVNPKAPVSLPDTAGWQHYHLLDLEEISVAEIERLFHAADTMQEILSRPIKHVPALRDKTVALLFYEASTRTRIAFETAARNLSATIINVSPQTSSVSKGESLLDTILTLESLGVDVIVMRHPCSGAPHTVASSVKAHLINGGDGWHAHPTQALLDIYTIRQRYPKLEGLKVVITGDITHSRVARSNIVAMSKLGMKVTLCAPPTLIPAGMPQSYPGITVEADFDKALAETDVVMMLRLQKERQESGLLPGLREYCRYYQLTPERLKLAKPEAMLMHPGPVNQGVELATGLIDCPQSVIRQQVHNGVAIRMALFYLITGSVKR